MKLEAIDVWGRLKAHRDAIPAGLVLASAILVVLVLVKVAGFFTTSTRAMELASKAALVGISGEGETAKHLEKSTNVADELKKKNLFAPPEAKQHPIKEVPGILGSQAFVNGKWYGEGQNIADAKVVSVEPTQVKIEWEGDEKTFAPIMAKSPGGPESGRRPGDRGGPGGDDKSGQKQPDVVVNVQGGPGSVRGFGGGPGGFSDMRQRFMNMSEQERNAFRQQMRDRFNSGGFGGFRGPGGPGGGRDFGRGGPGGGRGPR